jgi:hypothetical protein
MNPHHLKLPVIIDLQPEPENAILRLPDWMKYLFILLYICTLFGLGLLLKEGYGFFQLYQLKVQALRTAEQATRDIAGLNQTLVENRRTQNSYEQFKYRQRTIARPGPLLDWLPTLVGRAQRAHFISLQQANDRVNVRVTLEKAIADSVIQNPAPPPDYQIVQSGEETPKYQELPTNQRPSPKNEYAAFAAQLKKP